MWLPIKGFENYYEISDTGSVKSVRRCVLREYRVVLVNERILKTYLCRGYPAVKLCKDAKTTYRTIHQLIAEHFLPNPNNYECVNHKNGIKSDSRLENLEWCTYKQNINHAFDTGLLVRESKQYKNVRKAVKDLSTGEVYGSLKEASEKLNINKSTLNCYMSGHRKNKTSLVYDRAKNKVFE